MLLTTLKSVCRQADRLSLSPPVMLVNWPNTNINYQFFSILQVASLTHKETVHIDPLFWQYKKFYLNNSCLLFFSVTLVISYYFICSLVQPYVLITYWNIYLYNLFIHKKFYYFLKVLPYYACTKKNKCLNWVCQLYLPSCY